MCQHQPQCPAVDSPAHQLAHTVAAYPQQARSLPCNGVAVFDDLGQLLPLGVAAVAQAA